MNLMEIKARNVCQTYYASSDGISFVLSHDNISHTCESLLLTKPTCQQQLLTSILNPNSSNLVIILHPFRIATLNFTLKQGWHKHKDHPAGEKTTKMFWKKTSK